LLTLPSLPTCKILSFKLLLIASAFLLTLSTHLRAEEAKEVRFNRDVRTILSNSCFTCHGPDEGRREAEQRFDTEEGLLALQDSGGIVVGDPAASEMIKRILSDDPDLRMPPPDHPRQLSANDIAVLKQWIKEGAKWEPHWSFIVPERPVLPAGDSAKVGAIDQFINARLQKEKLARAEAADRATLLRRLSLDLTGLPPTAEALQRFLEAKTDSAYEQEVDRLLNSPQYGERMAVYWLDLVRYADSVGYHKDSHQEVWLYRDYVINAFNTNKPFDEFTVEQLAGDLLKGETFQEYEWKIASGLNRLNQTTSEGGAQAKEYLAKYSADRVRNTSAIFLGITMGCAECHDHKYDPIAAEDFYSFAAFFADIQERGVGVPAPTQLPTLENVIVGKSLEAELQSLKQKQETDPSAELQKQIDELNVKIAALLTDDLKKAWPKTLISNSGKPRPIRILPRGNWLDETGPVVTPAVPGEIGENVTFESPTRLDLARWIASPKNPLTARVFVNRVWRLMMGEGICRTVDDVGAQGQWPSHPELLDWLAVDFMENGWDVKRLVKQIAMSDAYRRSSVPTEQMLEQDPENHLFARQNRFRLPAELVRDNALAISGLLSTKMYGRSVRPYQPANYWFRMYHGGAYKQDHGEDLYRRGVYTYWRRSFWHPSLAVFDAPSREECVARRPRSNTPQQALALLNDPTYVEAARVLAEKMIAHGKSPEERIQWAFQRAVARNAEPWEVTALTQLLTSQTERYSSDEEAAKKLVSSGEYPVAKEISVTEHAAWTAVARAILNLHETITRN
jgi:hypothetical protein